MLYSIYFISAQRIKQLKTLNELEDKARRLQRHSNIHTQGNPSQIQAPSNPENDNEVCFKYIKKFLKKK